MLLLNYNQDNIRTFYFMFKFLKVLRLYAKEFECLKVGELERKVHCHNNQTIIVVRKVAFLTNLNE